MTRSLVFFLSTLPLIGATIDAPSTISAVTVYEDQARVTRTAELAVPEGEHVIRFSQLPEDLDTSSVQASGTGTGVKILGLEIRDHFSEAVINEKVRTLESELRALNDQVAVLTTKRADLAEQKKFLQAIRDGLAKPGEGEKAAAPGVDKIKPLYEFYATELDTLGKATLSNDVALRDLEPRKKVIEEELARLSGNTAKTEKEVLVAVKAGSGARAKLSLSYNMEPANWSPLYDARVNTKDGGIDLSYYGVISQKTGENWDDVKLALSTARPSEGAEMPELTPWWLQILEPRKAAQRFGYSDADTSAPAVPAPQEPFIEQVVVEEEAVINSGGISTVFEIKIPSTIPSDGETHQVPITTQKLDGTLEYVATPKLAETAFLRSHLTNTSGAPILGGSVNLFRDGDFVGQSEVDFIAAGAEFDLYLGADDSVKVTRKMLVDKASEGGLIQKRKGLTRKYEMTVENFRNQPVKVELLDQIPVAQDTTISVSNVRFSTDPTKQEKETGQLTWNFSLDPKQKKTVTVEFTVEWPADKQVSGL